MIVLPDDDDGSETGGGPPPDPSMREWRHPSEIAAAAAAAARTPSEDALSTEVSTAQARSPLNERPLRMLIGTIAGTAIGVVSLVGLALYLVGPGDSGANLAADDQQEGPAESLASAAIVNPSEDADEDASRLRTESADGDETPETEPAPETGESDSPDSGITTVPGPTIEAPEEEEIKESEPRALLDPGLRPPTEEQSAESSPPTNKTSPCPNKDCSRRRRLLRAIRTKVAEYSSIIDEKLKNEETKKTKKTKTSSRISESPSNLIEENEKLRQENEAYEAYINFIHNAYRQCFSPSSSS